MRKLLLNPTPLFRKLRQLSMLLTLLLALPQTAWGQDTDYGITIGRTPITSANKDDVFSDGKVSFTPATDTNPTNTLTLRGASIDGGTKPFEHGITVTNLANLTIVCAGDTYSEIYSTSSPIFCTDASCDLTFTSEQGYYNYIQFDQSATELVDGFKSESYVAEKAEQFLPQKQIGFITYKINFNHSDAGGAPSLNTKTRTFDTTHLNSANHNVLSGGGFTFDPTTCTLTILDGTKFGRLADAQLQQSAIYTEIQWGVDADLRVVINGDCQIIGGQHVNGNNTFTYYPFRNYDTSTMAAHTGRKISFEKGAGATNVNLALVGVDSLKSNLISGFAETDVSLSSDLKWVSGLPLNNSASLTTDCDIKVGTNPITVAGGKGGIDAGNGKIYFDAANKKMKMSYATADGAIVSNLDELTIEFIGENQVPYISSTNTSAPLTIIGLTDAQTPTSTLSLNSEDPNISAVNGFASVALDGAYMKTDHGCSYISENTRGYMQTPGSVNHLVNKMIFTTAHYYPLWIGGTTQVCDDNINDIFGNTSTSATNPITASFAPSSNTLTLNGLSIDSEFGIESGLSSLTINLIGQNSINTNTAYYYNPIYSHVATATLAIQKASNATDCELRLSSSSNNPQVIKGFASVSHTGLNFASKTGSSLDNSATKDAILTSATIYPLWVGGTLVTGTTTSGTDASSGSTVWEYDATNNKLTLTNYNKTDNDGHAFISNMANLNVYLVGTNSVGPNKNSQTSTGKAFYTTYTDATLTFSTDENNKGTLSASGYDIFCEGFRTVNGIYCNNGLGYFPGSREIKAKATPTISFSKRQQTGDTNPGDITSPLVAVGETETLTTTYGSAFYAPAPTFSNGEVLNDSTRFEYSYSVDGVVEFPNNGEDANNPGKIKYGEISLLKAGTVTITCSFPGNMQNNPCSASYTLQVNKADAAFQYVDRNSQTITTGNGFIDVDGTSKWGTPEAIGEAPTLSKPDDATAITYTSSNNDVATVSTAGVVTPKGAGSATITATIKDDERYNDATASYTLTVMVPATISFANATASIVNTETYTQTASTVPAGSTITYSSSNNDVNVNANGEVTISNSFYGKATITATVTAVPDADPQYYYVLPDNTAFQATYDLTVSKVFNSVTFVDGQNYATYYNGSENMTVPEGLTAYLITGTSGNSVVTYPINYLPQNVPLLLEKSGTAGSTLTNTIYSGTELTDAERGSNNLQYAEGNLGISDILGGTPYILYKNEFVKASGTIPQNHCYLLITNPAPTRGYYSIGHGNDGSTAIDDKLIDNEETTNDDWYDLQGRRIQKPTKAGIYIVNGKKMIVK